MAVIFNSIIALQHPGGVPSTQGAAFDLRWEKYRGRRDANMLPLKVKLAEDENGNTGWFYEQSEDAQLAEMIALLKSLEFPSQVDLAKALKVAPGTLSKRKNKAIALGLISDKEWDRCLELAKASEEPEVDF